MCTHVTSALAHNSVGLQLHWRSTCGLQRLFAYSRDRRSTWLVARSIDVHDCNACAAASLLHPCTRDSSRSPRLGLQAAACSASIARQTSVLQKHVTCTRLTSFARAQRAKLLGIFSLSVLQFGQIFCLWTLLFHQLAGSSVMMGRRLFTPIYTVNLADLSSPQPWNWPSFSGKNGKPNLLQPKSSPL